MHNEELRLQQTALEVKRSRLADIYDYAPVGYMTENELGMVLESNVMAATLLGVEKSSLFGEPLSSFMLMEDRIYTLSSANGSLRPTRLVKQNNGFINVFTEQGQGAAFEIYLPRHPVRADQLQQKNRSQPSPNNHANSGLAAQWYGYHRDMLHVDVTEPDSSKFKLIH